MEYQPEDPEFVRDCIRRRPAMYVGGTDTRGMTHLVWEVVANSVDQFLAGHASEVRVVIHGNRVEISDDGNGMPFDLADTAGENLASAYLRKIHVTPSADYHLPHVHCTDLHGVGVVAVNMLSREFTCSAWRNRQLWRQEFRKGVPTGAAQVIEHGNRRGTSVVFCPDEEIFGETSFDELRMRVQFLEIAHLQPGLRVSFNDETFCSKRGLADYVAIQDGARWNYRRSPRQIFSLTERFGDVAVNVAAAGAANETGFRSWVNGVSTEDGGSHVNGFQNALNDVGWTPALAAIHVVMHDPQFPGPTKARMESPTVARTLRKHLTPLLQSFCQQHGVGK